MNQDPAHSDADPNLGRVIGNRFRIDGVLGAGATGSVYRGTMVDTQEAVAIKVLDPELIVTNPQAQARFRREARQAQRVTHPNAMQVIDHGESDGMTYIVMELLEGRELYSAIYDDFPMPSERIARIMGEILAALAVAHDQGIVHRDLKPENIMLVKRKGADGVERETVKVADFGIAKTFADKSSDESMNLTRQGVIHGTPEYMAPEQAKGEALDGRADLYSCGAILYEMLAGELPFSSKNPFDVILKQVTAPVDLPSKRRPDIDRRLEPVIMKALEKKPADRYLDALSMQESLYQAVGMTLTASLVPDVARTPPPPADNSGKSPAVTTAASTPHATPVGTERSREPTPRELAATVEATSITPDAIAAAIAPAAVPKPATSSTAVTTPPPAKPAGFPMWVLALIALAIVGVVVLLATRSHGSVLGLLSPEVSLLRV